MDTVTDADAVTNADAATAVTPPAALPLTSVVAEQVSGGDRVSAARRVRSSVAELLVSLSPFSVVLLAYAAAQWVNRGLNADPVAGHRNALGFPLHVTEPIAVDRWMFGGVPTPWWQRLLYPDGAAHGWDALVAVVYSSHFVVVPVVGAVLWFRRRERFRPWVWSVLLLVLMGVALYIAYPMAPPWMAARDGYLEPVQRLSGLGWRVLGLDVLDAVQSQGQQQGNTVAAMPSLHAGAATVVAAFFWSGRGWFVRAGLTAYPVAMAFVLVLTGEHYVVDVLVGAALSVVAVLLVAGLGRRLHRRRVVRDGQLPGDGAASPVEPTGQQGDDGGPDGPALSAGRAPRPDDESGPPGVVRGRRGRG